MSEEVVESVAKSTSGSGSNALMGEFTHALDPKRRLTIPREWRRAMGDPDFVYVMRDRNGKCLDLLPKAEMESLLQKLRQKALFDPALTKAAMVIGANSEQLMIDVQGRIRISDKLLQFANLTTTVVMAGSVRMAKLWNEADYAAEVSTDLADLNAALDALEG